MIDVELDLRTDIDQHLFIEKGIKGGVVMISHGYAQANATMAWKITTLANAIAI